MSAVYLCIVSLTEGDEGLWPTGRAPRAILNAPHLTPLKAQAVPPPTQLVAMASLLSLLSLLRTDGSYTVAACVRRSAGEHVELLSAAAGWPSGHDCRSTDRALHYLEVHESGLHQ